MTSRANGRVFDYDPIFTPMILLKYTLAARHLRWEIVGQHEFVISAAI